MLFTTCTRKLNHEKSEFFNCEIGVRLGESLSPLFFATLKNICHNTVQTVMSLCSNMTQLSNELTFLKLFFILLYADDMVTFG